MIVIIHWVYVVSYSDLEVRAVSCSAASAVLSVTGMT